MLRRREGEPELRRTREEEGEGAGGTTGNVAFTVCQNFCYMHFIKHTTKEAFVVCRVMEHIADV